MEKPKCNYYDVCGLYADADEKPPLCILHSRNPDKDKQLFSTSLAEHRVEKPYNLRGICFPEVANFSMATVFKRPDFSETTFYKEADFSGATFDKGADFSWAAFSKRADFSEATFDKGAKFIKTTFSEEAVFIEARFSKKKADFSAATFSKAAVFVWATFSKEADFFPATFSKEADFFAAMFSEEADFSSATFLGRTTFIGRHLKGEKADLIFSGIKNEVDFRNINLDPLQGLIFRDADLRKCLFEQTDLRKAEFTGVSWPKPGNRFQVYDEIRPLNENETRKWHHIERFYRELKQNYEDRRDYERAGDFHYGEKEIRRKNPDTPFLLKRLLTLYWTVSGYGERYIRPLLWAFGLLVTSTFGYLILGIAPDKNWIPLTLTNVEDWLHVGLYSLQVTTLLRPTDLVPLGIAAIGVKVVQSLLGPIIIGLFALAVRQRLKR